MKIPVLGPICRFLREFFFFFCSFQTFSTRPSPTNSKRTKLPALPRRTIPNDFGSHKPACSVVEYCANGGFSRSWNLANEASERLFRGQEACVNKTLDTCINGQIQQSNKKKKYKTNDKNGNKQRRICI